MSALKENGRWVADVRFNANRFAIQDPAQPDNSGSKKYPFIIDGGVVFMNTAVIKDASIGSAKIQNLNANKIVTGSLLASSNVSSSNFAQGSQGWIIRGNGSAEFESAVIRGKLTAGQIADLSIGPTHIADYSATRVQTFTHEVVAAVTGSRDLDSILELGQGGIAAVKDIVLFCRVLGTCTGGTVYTYNIAGQQLFGLDWNMAQGPSQYARMQAYVPNASGPQVIRTEVRNKTGTGNIVVYLVAVISRK
jgi:hypothetical protein